MTGPLRSRPSSAGAAATAREPAADGGDAAESPDLLDPQHHPGIALPGCIDPAVPPEDLLLDWLIGLPDGLDPAEAARRLITADGAETPRNDRLLVLLAEVAQWPLRRLARLGGARAIRQKSRQAKL